MKKLFVLLLAVFVLTSVAMVAVACGEEEATTTTVADETTVADVSTTEAGSTALTPAEGKALGDALLVEYQAAGSPDDKTAFVEEGVVVAGPVFAVKDKGTFAIVSLGDEENPFNVLITYETFEAAGLTLDDLSAWMGQEVQVSGDIVINDWGSLTEVQITDLSQITVL